MFNFFDQEEYDKNDETVKYGIERGHFRIDENDKVVMTERGEGFKEALEDVVEMFGSKQRFAKAAIYAALERTTLDMVKGIK